VSAPDGFSLVETEELARLRAVDAKHGWKERHIAGLKAKGGP